MGPDISLYAMAGFFSGIFRAVKRGRFIESFIAVKIKLFELNFVMCRN
jgi:hypothetical protein